MKINFNFDDESAVWEVLDQFFLAMLKQNLKSELESYGKDKIFNHPDDIKESKKRVKAIKLLMKEYIAPSEYDGWVQTWIPKTEMWE